jgi:hypothetical protein
MLTDRDIQAIADAVAPRVAALLRAEDSRFPSRGLVDVDGVRELLGVEREWVYQHKVELGAVRLGDGDRGPLRFEVAKVLGYLADRRLGRRDEDTARRGRPPRRREGFDVLPIPDAIR